MRQVKTNIENDTDPIYLSIISLNNFQRSENLEEMVGNLKRKLLCMKNVLVEFVVGVQI